MGERSCCKTLCSTDHESWCENKEIKKSTVEVILFVMCIMVALGLSMSYLLDIHEGLRDSETCGQNCLQDAQEIIALIIMVIGIVLVGFVAFIVKFWQKQ